MINCDASLLRILHFKRHSFHPHLEHQTKPNQTKQNKPTTKCALCGRVIFHLCWNLSERLEERRTPRPSQGIRDPRSTRPSPTDIGTPGLILPRVNFVPEQSSCPQSSDLSKSLWKDHQFWMGFRMGVIRDDVNKGHCQIRCLSHVKAISTTLHLCPLLNLNLSVTFELFLALFPPLSQA